MDINDIEARLKRVHASIGSVIIQDHDKLVSFSEDQGEKPGSRSISMHFGPSDENEKWALVENVVGALARLKDNLKKRMTSLGHNAQLVEDEINNTLVLQLVTDLDNAFKHGYPANSNRSKKRPKLTNLTSSLRIYGTSTAEQTTEQVLSDYQNGAIPNGASITFDFVNNTQTYKAANDTKMIINAEVVDEHMNYIVDLDDMINDSILKWEMFAAKYKLKT